MGCLRGRGQPLPRPRLLSALERAAAPAPNAAGCRSMPRCATAPAALVACAPCYAKSHSQGEYVFDHGWAERWSAPAGATTQAYSRGCPSARVPGPRLLLNPEAGLPVAGAGAGVVQACQGLGTSSVHVTFLHRRGMGCLGEAGWLQIASARSSTGQSRLWQLRGFPRRARRAQAQGAAAGTARGGGERGWCCVACAWRRSRRAIGRPSTASTQQPRPQMGPQRYLDQALLADAGRTPGDAVVLMGRGARWRTRRRRAEPAGAGGALRPQLGRGGGTCPSCISSSATIWRWTSRSPMGFPRRGRPQGEHKIQRGYLPGRPIPPIGSRIAACPTRWPTSSPANARRCCGRWRCSPPSRRSGRRAAADTRRPSGGHGPCPDRPAGRVT